MTKWRITIGWLYPDLMNVYGDRGNLIALVQRCKWREIEVKVNYLNPGFTKAELEDCNLLLMGGAQDRQQTIVNEDLKKYKKILSEMIEKEVPGLYVCGGFQFLGNYYKEADGSEIPGLGIFDLHTANPGTKFKRLIGNLAFETEIFSHQPSAISHKQTIVGFENHGGRTYLGAGVEPFGKVLKGFGNNGEDGFEGAVYKNSFGTYSHGPILPKNPSFADYLIEKALGKKYKGLTLSDLDDSLENMARSSIAKRLGVEI